jgi:ribosomal protein S18 acetylase RimI-like enzyme
MDRPSPAIAASLVLAREPFTGEGPQWVVARAEEELVVRYGFLDEGERGLTAAMFDPPAGAFLVARRADATGAPLGGVGLRAVHPGLPPAVGEIRRLWVDPAQREQGIGRRLIAAMEDTARHMGLTALRLVTGENQPEAIALYRSTGWELAHLDTAKCGYRFTKELGGPQ